jgi:hypothetical protein
METNVAEHRLVLTIIISAALFGTDNLLGLPHFIFYSPVIQLLFKVWVGCYNTANPFRISEDECSFLFRWFLLGGVLDNDEIEASLGQALRICSQLNMQKRGWSALAELFWFASQQGRVSQPWGIQCFRWIRKHRL